MLFFVFFFNDTATTEIYTYLHTLSLHDALPISNCCLRATDLRASRRRAAVSGSSRVVIRNRMARISSAAAQTCTTVCQPIAAMTRGASRAVNAAPPLPVPKIPRADLTRRGGVKRRAEHRSVGKGGVSMWISGGG